MSIPWERMGQTESPTETQLCIHPWLPSGCQADAVSQPDRCQQIESVIPCSELHNPAHLCPTAALCLQESLQTLMVHEGWFPACNDPHTMSKNWGQCWWSGASQQQRDQLLQCWWWLAALEDTRVYQCCFHCLCSPFHYTGQIKKWELCLPSG